jgi:NNP family nitrate/nitrite transporter-like MFS transporter
MLLYGTVCVSLIFMHFSFRPESAAIARQHAASPSTTS